MGFHSCGAGERAKENSNVGNLKMDARLISEIGHMAALSPALHCSDLQQNGNRNRYYASLTIRFMEG